MADLAANTRSRRPLVSTADEAAVRADFPILTREVHGKSLVYLDSAATTQKPRQVIDTVTDFYETYNANIHRGLHTLAVEATEAYETAREKARAFLNAKSAKEIVFCRGTTEAVNLVAQTFGRQRIGPDDEVIVTGMEHHSNIVPWQLVCEQQGAKVKVLPIADDGRLCIEDLEELITKRTRMIAMVHISNALGTVNDIEKVVALAHHHGVPVLVDGAQAAARVDVDVQALGCDFYTVSGHKMYAPTGIGVLYGRAEHLDAMPPYQGGGEMILTVSFDGTTYNEIPHKFEAGTPNIAGAIGLGAAIDYVQSFGRYAIGAHEQKLVQYATKKLQSFGNVRLFGQAPQRAGVVSFNLGDIHPHDLGTILDTEGVAIRAGHHCAQPVMKRFGVPATARASFGIYSTADDIDRMIAALGKARELFA